MGTNKSISKSDSSSFRNKMNNKVEITELMEAYDLTINEMCLSMIKRFEKSHQGFLCNH